MGERETVEELMEKYKISAEEAEYILSNYGTMDAFIDQWTSPEGISPEDEWRLRYSLMGTIDISGERNGYWGFERLYNDIMKATDRKERPTKRLRIIDSRKILSFLENLRENNILTQKELDTILALYGLENGSSMTSQEMSSKRPNNTARTEERNWIARTKEKVIKLLSENLGEFDEDGKYEGDRRTAKIRSFLIEGGKIFYSPDGASAEERREYLGKVIKDPNAQAKYVEERRKAREAKKKSREEAKARSQNRDTSKELTGLSDEEIAQLQETGVLGDNN